MSAPESAVTVQRLAGVDAAQLEALAELLIDGVDGGASIGFVHPLAPERARAFWRQVAEGVERGERALFVANVARGLVGTVQLVLAQPENQPHRADVAKMLVLRRARRCGIGARLMRAAESAAHAAGKTLLVLDTASAEAARLYARLGWQAVGSIPDYALLPRGGTCATTYFYRRVEREGPEPA